MPNLVKVHSRRLKYTLAYASIVFKFKNKNNLNFLKVHVDFSSEHLNLIKIEKKFII